jgi:hypothetical protein
MRVNITEFIRSSQCSINTLTLISNLFISQFVSINLIFIS